MKRLTYLLCFTLGTLSSCGASAARTAPEPEKAQSSDTPRTPTVRASDEAIQKYFTSTLTRGAEALPASTLSLEDIKKARTQVWRLWAEANKSLTEDKLPALTPLSKQSVAHSWLLTPEMYNGESFEAVMPFYYGSKGDKPEAGYPLYLYLHGSGDKNSEWSTGLALALSFQDSPSAYFIPQIPNGVGELYRWWQKSKLEAWEKLLRQAFLSDQIDPKRIYFFGISEGGYGSQRLASYYADYLAGAGPMAGGEPLINAPVENLQHVAFSLRTGYNDTQFHRSELTGYTRDALQRLAAQYPGYYKHFIDIIPKYGHAIPYQYTTPYLSQHVRTPQPNQVNWEDYPIDGLYRKGCYNLAPLKRPEGKERTYYQENILGNTVDLKINTVKYVEKLVSDYYKQYFHLVLLYDKVYEPAKGGKLRVYLSPELLDLSKPVRVLVNGQQVYSGMVKADWSHLVESCSRFFDPERLFPAAIDIAY